jgi:hypothetical protein
MSGIAYNPPLEQLAIFDPSVFIYDQTALTQQSALTNFLAFPTAQGTETFGDLISNGTATLNTTIQSGTATFNGLSNFNNRATFTTSTFNNQADFNSIVNLNSTANINTANISNTLSLLNGANSSLIDMDASNNFVINNNYNGGQIFFTIKDPTLNQVCNTLSYTKSNGLRSICNVLNDNFICFTASSSSTTTSLQLCVSPNGGTYNNLVSPNDPFIVGTGAGSNLGSLVLTTWSSSRLGIRINSNGVNSVEVAGALIQLNATTTGGLTSTTPQPASTDSSTKIPTTAWVQSAITGSATAPMPYYQAYYFINAPSNFDRAGYFQFNFTGANFDVNDYFSFQARIVLTTTTSTLTAIAPNSTNINFTCDVYPARCPANSTNPSAYGNNPTLPTTTNFSLMNGSIYNGSALQSTYVVSSAGSPYVPLGRWYFVSGYSITSQGTSYPTTSPSPLAPYIAYGTAQQSAFGIGVWNTQLCNTNYSIEIQLLNRGPNGTGQGITLTSNYSLSGGNKLNEVKVGL